MGNLPEIVSREEWLAARKELLIREKELTRAADRLNADRRRLPMVRVDKAYTFEGPDGTAGLLDLFQGRQQLVMHHFMFAPEWETGCPSCSSAADGIAGLRQLHARVAPVLLHLRTEAELAVAGTPWTGGPWTEDMRGTEMPALSAFLRVGDDVFHTYSTYGRGLEEFHNGNAYLDLTALGRQEDWEEPKGRPNLSACRSAVRRYGFPTSTSDATGALQGLNRRIPTPQIFVAGRVPGVHGCLGNRSVAFRQSDDRRGVPCRQSCPLAG